MSLTMTVTEMVCERGAATVDDLLPELAKDGYSRAQVEKALQNAKFRGLLDCRRGKGKGGGRGSVPGTYMPARPKVLAPGVGAVSSVWQLGARNA